MGTPDIKIITGVRRSGKSKLLESFKEYILKNAADTNIIHINFNITKFENLKEYHALENYIENAYIYGKENIVAIELLRRGYEVYVGVLYKKEVDFVAIKRNEKIYIQVLDNISDDKTFEREVSPLLKINDAYPKMVIARIRHEEYQYEGVRMVDISDWLMNE
ncbi:MAG: AAA family ATPase [Erysipelotrichaceae bacterium]|jgi:predicted AAA+ superfamily ATPase|nr:AAA family ATPase [Erysipelotrichaceae bacterium]